MQISIDQANVYFTIYQSIGMIFSDLYSINQNTQRVFFSVSLQKERDLELAARIGQSLLKKNKTLSERNSFLEEQVEHIREEVRDVYYSLKVLRTSSTLMFN